MRWEDWVRMRSVRDELLDALDRSLAEGVLTEKTHAVIDRKIDDVFRELRAIGFWETPKEERR